MLAELAGGFAVMGDVQFLPGYCVLLGKDPTVTSLAAMPRAARVQFLADADLLATAVERACSAVDGAFRRVNLEVLGNADAFVHAHVWPRYEWEPSALRDRPVAVRPRSLERASHSPRSGARCTSCADHDRARRTQARGRSTDPCGPVTDRLLRLRLRALPALGA